MLQEGSAADRGMVQPSNHPGRRTREPSCGRFWKRGFRAILGDARGSTSLNGS